MKDIISLCKRRGFVFQSSEIYGGLSSCWDYGPLGTILKQEIKKLWFEDMLNYEEIEPLDASILMHPLVWKASGHVDHFTDPLVECNHCHKRFRQDHLIDPLTCPSCHKKDLSAPRNFNGLFKTKMGVVEDEASDVYLRPETAQGIFVNFLNVQESMRKKIPFGIAQIGKSFRNEITPGHFIFRTREFEQMEMQYFIPPGEQKKYFDLWKERRYEWIISLGINPSSIREKNHETLAHYADFAIDFEFNFPMGFSELEGIHSRTDFDLKSHETFSKKNLHYVDQAANKKFIPYVIETSIGCDRLLLALLCNAYKVDNERIYLDLIPKLAPKQVAIFPLINKDPLIEPALKIYKDLKKKYRVIFDDQGSIGKRYRRQDEIGTPYCITFDFDSLNDQKITIRDRNSSSQQRISIDKIHEFLSL